MISLFKKGVGLEKTTLHLFANDVGILAKRQLAMTINYRSVTLRRVTWDMDEFCTLIRYTSN